MHIAILGNGIAGVSAARTLRKLDPGLSITMISGESDFHFSRPALMYLYMGHMRSADLKPYEDWFWKENRIELLNGWVDQIDFPSRQLHFSDGRLLAYDRLLLATGSVTSYYNWPGQDLDGVHGMVTLQDVAQMERHSDSGINRAVIVGGGLIGIEMAECFHTRRIPVSFLVREASYWNAVLPAEESEMVNQQIRQKHGIDLHLGSELEAILGDDMQRVRAVKLKSGEEIECQFVGITAGVKPNVDWLRSGELEIDRGILTDNFLQSSQTGVYAAGDCVQLREPQPGRRPIEAIWYTARMMGEVAAHNMLGKSIPYQPGVFFNSAKFFDLEYQVYGQTPIQLPNDQSWLLWQHPSQPKAARLYWDSQTRAVRGFHLMGIRYRHEVCEGWIEQQTPIEEVIENLPLANFDPEFFESYEAEILNAFNRQENTRLALRQKRKLGAVQKLLSGWRHRHSVKTGSALLS